MKVGVRELRNNLSRYLERVKSGTDLVVTQHGREVAKVVPISGGTEEPSALDRLISEGLASAPAKDHRSLPTGVLQANAPVSPLVADQRR